MKLLASPATGVLEWVRDYAAQNAAVVLGQIAVAALLVPPQMRVTLVDEYFRRDPKLEYLIVQSPDGPVLVERPWFESVIAGRLGYGRLLYARKSILELATHKSILLAHDSTIEAAASAVISRRGTGRAPTAVIVDGPDGILKVAHVSTLFERLAHQYAFQSWNDPLTQLPNRRYLREQVKVLEHARTATDEEWRVVLFRLDVDQFKTINDTFGQAVGDRVLAEVAQRIRAVSRREDLVVRLGGDEFAVLTAAPFTRQERDAFAARLVEVAAVPMELELVDNQGGDAPRFMTVSASVGVAYSGDHGNGAVRGSMKGVLDELLRRADFAVRQAKDEGRGQARHFVAAEP